VNLPASLKIQYASQVAGLAAVLVAAAAFIGWWADLPLLASWAGASSSTPTRLAPIFLMCPAPIWQIALNYIGAKTTGAQFEVGVDL
jgi:hypothetical protein